MWRHRNSNIWNYGIGYHIQKNTIKKSPFIENQSVSAKWWGDISIGLLWWLHTNPCKTIQAISRRINFESSEYNVAYISSPVYINRLIFLASEQFRLVLFGYANQSHNFTNLVFVKLSLLFSVARWHSWGWTFRGGNFLAFIFTSLIYADPTCIITRQPPPK